MNVVFNKSRLIFSKELPKDIEYKNILRAEECMDESLLHYDQTIGTKVSFIEDAGHVFATYKYDVQSLSGEVLDISMIRANYKSAIAFVDVDGNVVDYRKSLVDESYSSIEIVSSDIVVPENSKYLYVTASSHYVSIGRAYKRGYLRDITNSLQILGIGVDNGYAQGLCNRILTSAYCRAAKYVANEDCILHVVCSTIARRAASSLFIIDGSGVDINLPDGVISEAIGFVNPSCIYPVDCYVPVKKGSEIYINFRYNSGVMPTDQFLYEDTPIQDLKVEVVE